MRKLKYSILFVSIFLSIPLLVSAYQPRLVSENAQLVKIENPEISQAFYGELDGEPDIYKISSEDSFNLYVGVLSPLIDTARKDFLVKIETEDSSLVGFPVVLDGQGYTWTTFYEEFAGDDYWFGPEFPKQIEGPPSPRKGEAMADEGEYQITVSSPDNLGKYVLVVGFKEEFSEEEMKNAVKIIPIIKTEFFGKSPRSLFEGEVGKMALWGLGIFIVIIGLITWLILFLFKKFKRKSNKKKKK